MEQSQPQPQYELTVQMVHGALGGKLLHATDLPEEAARLLSIDLIDLIQAIHRRTDNYPITGDHLFLEDSKGDLRYDGAAYSERMLRAGEMENWIITKRTYSNSMGGLWLLFEVRLARLDFIGPPDEAFDLDAILRLLPTPQARRAFQRWATHKKGAVQTWWQLAQWGHELSSERGFAGHHFAVIERALQKHGYSLVKG